MQGVPARLRRERQSPSSAIYVAAPLGDLIASHRSPARPMGPAPGFELGRPVRYLTPNSFHIKGGHTIVVRDWSPVARRRVGRIYKGALAYIIDDDVIAGATDANLPVAYRRRLQNLANGSHAELLQRADIVLAPSDVLADRLRYRTMADVEVIAPSLIGSVGDLDHHSGRDLRIVFPNTRSHIVDWRTIQPTVDRFLSAHPMSSLVTFLHDIGGVSDCRNVQHRRPASWDRFRDYTLRERFHVALLPGVATDFNTARSHNKLLECAVWGAVPVVSRNLPYASIVEKHESGIVCGDDPAEWREALEALQEPGLRQRLAGRNIEFASREGDPELMRKRWLSVFGLECWPT